MADPGRFARPSPYRLRLWGSGLAVCAALGSLAEALGERWLWLACGGGVVLGTIVGGGLAMREYRVTTGEERRDWLGRLVTTRPGREQVPFAKQLSPYDLGADPEAIGPDDATEYLPRDKDDELREALVRARRAAEPSMVVLRGPSKSGKSRTLFEAVMADEDLRQAAVLAPRDIDALAGLLDDGQPQPPPGQLVLWLDDLERFVSAGHDGIDRVALDTLSGWEQPIVVVATAGGKGAEQLLDAGLAVPIRQLYNHRRVEVISLSSELNPREQARVRERFRPDVAQQVLAHGIGEYLVAAPDLARKLEEERHRPGEPECPEGAAVAWAAIDWSRSGMTAAISEPLLRELWPLYLRGIQPTDERFTRGLDWALRPVYRSVALVYETSSYEAYDWIVSHADTRLEREVNALAWERMMREVDPGASFDLAVAAYQKGALDESRRAFQQAIKSRDESVAANSAFNLGYLLAEQDDLEGARAAYRRAMDSDEAEPAAMAALNLGIMLQAQGDATGAASAYRRGMECGVAGHSATAALNLAVLREREGDVGEARTAYTAAARDDDAQLASRASFMLGNLLQEDRPQEAADAFTKAIDLGDPEIAPAASYLLGELLEPSDPAGARAAYRGAVESPSSAVAPLAKARLAALADAPDREPASLTPVPPPAPQAAFNRALVLDEEGDVVGARRAYEEVSDSSHRDLAPAAAFSLAVLLGKHDEPDAEAWYKRAISSGHPKIAPAATFGLGALLARRGDAEGARSVLERAATSEERDIAAAAQAALEDLP